MKRSQKRTSRNEVTDIKKKIGLQSIEDFLPKKDKTFIQNKICFRIENPLEMRIVRVQDAATDIALLQRRKVVVLAGSGVSIWQPTTLPSGASVTSAIWETLLDGVHLSTEESNLLQDLAIDFPFEHVFEVCPNQSKARDFLISLYDCRIANPVHSLIAEATENGLVESIITTNYDHCFEAAFSAFPHTPLKIVSNETQANSTAISSGEILLFKVHGTADFHSDSLIFTLRNEGLLPIGKRTLLSNQMSNALCLFVGYSGLDFDLCPLIAQLPGTEIFWIGREPEPHTTNAKHLLNDANGTYIYGDMLEALAKWTGIRCRATLARNFITPADIRRVFNEEELAIWRVALFNALGFPKMALQVLATDRARIPEPKRLLQESQSLFYAAKYEQASESYASLARLLAKSGSKKQSSDVWLDTSDSFRAGGYFLRALISLLKGRWSASDFDKAKYYLKKSLLISNFLEGLDTVKAPRCLRQLVKDRLKHNLNSCLRMAIEQGSLHDFQQVGFLAEKHEVDLDSTGLFAPKGSSEGYKHLGYYHAEIMSFNEKERQRDFATLTAVEVSSLTDEIDKFVSHCELTGQDSSVWKLLAIKKRLFETHGIIFQERDKLLSSLDNCEYSSRMKKSQMSRFGLRR